MESKVKAFRLPIALVLLCVAGVAGAAGFGDGYTLKYGDFNGDGRRDLMVQAPRPRIVPISVDDIFVPVKLCCDEPDKVLINNGGGNFTLINALTTAQKLITALWPIADEVFLNDRDFDVDGKIDLEIMGIKSLITDADDLILYHNGSGIAPQIKRETLSFKRFHTQVALWERDNNFFEANAPLVITRTSAPTGQRWYASVMDMNNQFLIQKFLSECRMRFPNRQCGATRIFPPGEPCYRTVAIYDSNGNFIKNDTVNLCDYEIHIVTYTGGTVTYEKDYTVFEPEARETAEILRRLNSGGCHAMPTTDEERIRMIYESQMSRWLARLPNADTPNHWRHARFPGDDLFDPGEATYHHYDVRMRVCPANATNCNPVTINAVHRYFSFPHYKLGPKMTGLDGSYEMAYIAPPYFTGDKSNYVIPAGLISQKTVTDTPPWVGAIQNITQPDHLVHPGTISRIVQGEADGVYVFTHGIGYNRARCALTENMRPINIIAGNQNDIHGRAAFAQLNIEMIRYWKRNYGGTTVRKITPEGPEDRSDWNPVIIE
jgi:hypothetical protein